jgi:hypothetical protein
MQSPPCRSSSEYGNKPWGFVKDGEFLDQLVANQLIKQDCHAVFVGLPAYMTKD